ncbi:hypothetical protein EVAR_22484_1 [Eumeta japonica]|uniref:Mariner Mos1 transposase n=1 Tax=Eumeta variegata TaxID=151549 RepID=A0A4C1VDI5_EUMVA|nr:hypothetical protein EVAR_22484_1 [Eumeta japonica]
MLSFLTGAYYALTASVGAKVNKIGRPAESKAEVVSFVGLCLAGMLPHNEAHVCITGILSNSSFSRGYDCACVQACFTAKAQAASTYLYLKRRGMIYDDFKLDVSEEQYVQRLKSAFNNEPPSRATIPRATCFHDLDSLVTAIKLKGQKTVTAARYTQQCLSEVIETLRIRGLMLHHDSASSHTAALILNYLKENYIVILEHRPYPSDFSVSHFWIEMLMRKHCYRLRRAVAACAHVPHA